MIHSTPKQPPLLEVEGLAISFATGNTKMPVIREVSFQLDASQSLGVVGESGSGKSVTAMAIPRLLPKPHAVIDAGKIRLKSEDVLDMSQAALHRVRRDLIGVIFQDPRSSLNPVRTIGSQITEVLRLRKSRMGGAKIDAIARAKQLLLEVQLSEEVMTKYPFELSGGMLQRAMIAMALVKDPELLIADEPTTALDATIASEILGLLQELCQKRGMALLLISHDLPLLSRMVSSVLVMHAGRIVERGPMIEVYKNPAHPYTKSLLGASPLCASQRKTRLPTVGGSNTFGRAQVEERGCAFYDRCPVRRDPCRNTSPKETVVEANHRVSCFGFEYSEPLKKET